MGGAARGVVVVSVKARGRSVFGPFTPPLPRPASSLDPVPGPDASAEPGTSFRVIMTFLFRTGSASMPIGYACGPGPKP